MRAERAGAGLWPEEGGRERPREIARRIAELAEDPRWRGLGEDEALELGKAWGRAWREAWEGELARRAGAGPFGEDFGESGAGYGYGEPEALEAAGSAGWPGGAARGLALAGGFGNAAGLEIWAREGEESEEFRAWAAALARGLGRCAALDSLEEAARSLEMMGSLEGDRAAERLREEARKAAARLEAERLEEAAEGAAKAARRARL